MKNLLWIILIVAAAVAGVGLVVVADRAGWLERGSVAETAVCRHELEPGRCPFCTPALVEELGWCGGHDVPEALCTRCNPTLVGAFRIEGDWCGEHGLPESQCALCAGGTPEAVAVDADTPRAFRAPSATCAKVASVVQLASADVARRTGLAVHEVETRPIEQTVDASVELVFDETRFAHLASRSPGVVASVNAGLGQKVEAGELLAEVDSTGLGSAKATFLQARSLVELWKGNHEREQRLLERAVATDRDVLEARTKLVESQIALSDAEQVLRNLGLSDEAIAEVAATSDTSSRLPVRAPFAGTVVARHAVLGEIVDPTRPLFAITDTSLLWAMLDIYERDSAKVAIGQPVDIALQALPERSFTGRLTWISAEVDPRTRTLRARAVIENAEGLLRANMFGLARITVRSIDDAIVVPKSAVQWEGCCNVVFVRHTETVYQPYRVQIVAEQGDYYVVEDGVPPGEQVVTDGSFLLKTEILKGNIGAGCCEIDPGKDR